MKTEIRKEIGKYLVIDPEICHGTLTFKGTRIFVSDVIEQVSDGKSIKDIINSWYGKVSKEAIIEALFFYTKLSFNNNSDKFEKLVNKFQMSADS